MLACEVAHDLPRCHLTLALARSHELSYQPVVFLDFMEAQSVRIAPRQPLLQAVLFPMLPQSKADPYSSGWARDPQTLTAARLCGRRSLGFGSGRRVNNSNEKLARVRNPCSARQCLACFIRPLISDEIH